MSTAGLTIRYATLADNRLLAELGARTFHDAFIADNTPENIAAYIGQAFKAAQLSAELADPRSVFFIAEIEGIPAGYARLYAGKAPSAVCGRRPIELVRIYALQEWIGHGIGAALMQACLEEARKREHDILWLGVWETNPRAIHFYQKWGFAEVGSQSFQLGDEIQTDVLMQKAI